jgi:hypothetical protein
VCAEVTLGLVSGTECSRSLLRQKLCMHDTTNIKRMLFIEGGVRYSFTLTMRAGTMASARDEAEITTEIPKEHLSSCLLILQW